MRRFAFAALLLILSLGTARAETIAIARQYGVAFLPFIVMEEQKLIEKHAAQLGQPDLSVNWVVVSGAAAMTDSLLSGAVALGAGAPPGLILLWDRTHGTANAVLGIGAIAVMPTTLITRNPNLHSIADLSETDRIALPSVKISNAALVLEMEAARRYGMASYDRFDHLTLSLGHPEAAQQISGNGQVNSHFASPPFEHLELRNPAVHTVLSSVDVMGDTSLTDVWTTRKFATSHPITVQAMFDAMGEAIATINADRSAAADLYLRVTQDRIGKAALMEVLADPHIRYSTTPLGTMAFADFMHRTGTIKSMPGSWKEMFLPLAHGLDGN